MAITNYERVGRTLQVLREGLAPYVAREAEEALAEQRVNRHTLEKYLTDPNLREQPMENWDASALLRFMWYAWNDVFRDSLGHTDRSLVSELREWRNKWAHQNAFSSDDVLRVMDSAERLLKSVGGAEQAARIERDRKELLRLIFDEQLRSEQRKKKTRPLETTAASGLAPWREVIEPHDDVASGRYQLAEFAADLWQVYQGEGSDEYRDPVEFFRRTYLTESLSQLLVRAAERAQGSGGDPVIQLQTNFGGGKTHSMLALYHMFSGKRPADLPGVEQLLAKAGIDELPKMNRVVLVGNRMKPGSPSEKEDGTKVHTLWGELAWQLGMSAGGPEEARKAYEVVRQDDENATNPGEALQALLKRYAPALILIDEWVAYARQLLEEQRLPGGDFETQFTFAQALTEAVKAVPKTLLVVSLPASDDADEVNDIEVGGRRGREALRRLQNVIGRIESPWRPATQEESFEIVRRRLFKPIRDNEAFKKRDLTARAFADMYRGQASEFPPETREADYEKRIRASYPIHPEVFDRLYTDWSSLARFQRTRGVLRLMAAVIHVLWENGDKSPLIMPASLPLDTDEVQRELVRHLPDNWTPIIDKDVDGPDSLPVELDNTQPNLGRYQATRRVARTIFLGSAPRAGAAQQGLEVRRIKLGAVMPGEQPAAFGDALRHLAARATFLYQDGDRYWYDTQPTVGKLVEDRAEQLKRQPERVLEELERRLRGALRHKGDFAAVHPLPRGAADVPDEPETRLVALPPDHPHRGGNGGSPAMELARAILESRGSAPRHFRNALVFLAADASDYQDLDEAARRYLAWKSVLDDKEQLNLTPFQVRQAEAQLRQAEETLGARIPQTYRWLLVPEQQAPQEPLVIQPLSLRGQGELAARASKKLVQGEQLVLRLAPSVLRKHLDGVPLWEDGRHVSVARLVEYFASYPYLHRLRDPQVLLRSVEEGAGMLTWFADGFAYAESYDAEKGRYVGLVAGQQPPRLTQPTGLVVHPDVAQKQLEQEVAVQKPDEETPAATGGAVPKGVGEGAGAVDVTGGGSGTAEPKPRRFYVKQRVGPADLTKTSQQLAEELVVHLAKLPGSRVEITIEVAADVPDGMPAEVVRIVRENATALGMEPQFEEE